MTTILNPYLYCTDARADLLPPPPPLPHTHTLSPPSPHPPIALGLPHRFLGLHVDNCLGGILLSCLQEQGLYNGTWFDFRVDGVSTISIDIHKYVR